MICVTLSLRGGGPFGRKSCSPGRVTTIRRASPPAKRPWFFALSALVAVSGRVYSAEPVALRVESLLVPPASQPLALVVVKNLQDVPYQGTVAIEVPQGWKIHPPVRDVSLQPGQVERVSFDVERGVSVETNCYPIEATATGLGVTVSRSQDVVCASAPYFKPVIDGDPSDWKDSIPVTFTCRGRSTVISTYWNSRRFSLLIAVEEDELLGCPTGVLPDLFDAVQLAISPKDTATGTSLNEEATRYEFLFVGPKSGAGGRCFQLAAPGMPLAEAAKCRPLAPLEYGDAEVAVSRRASTTYYEIAIPFGPMRDRIRPSEGREFFLSLLVHDPDGTGIRDWGQAAGLWPSERNRLAWSRWPGAKWSDEPPFDNKLPWGLCSSKY